MRNRPWQGPVGGAWWPCPDEQPVSAMSDLTIAASGEVKLGYELVGTIAFAGPTAHLDVAGDWWLPDDQWDEMRERIDELETDLFASEETVKRQGKMILKLRAILAEVRAMHGVEA